MEKKKTYAIFFVAILSIFSVCALLYYETVQENNSKLSGEFTYSVSGTDRFYGFNYSGNYVINMNNGNQTGVIDSIEQSSTYKEQFPKIVMPPYYDGIECSNHVLNSIVSKNSTLSDLKYISQTDMNTNFGKIHVYIFYDSDGNTYDRYYVGENGIIYEKDIYSLFELKYKLVSYNLR